MYVFLCLVDLLWMLNGAFGFSIAVSVRENNLRNNLRLGWKEPARFWHPDVITYVQSNKMPAVGVEPTRAKGPPDFESGTSTSFITPAVLRGRNEGI